MYFDNTLRRWVARYKGQKKYGRTWAEAQAKLNAMLTPSPEPKPIRRRRSGHEIPLGDRFFVLKRDGWRCRYCGAQGPDVKLVIDHVRSVRDGGGHGVSNLVTACEPCNLGKAGQSLDINDIPPPPLRLVRAVDLLNRRREGGAA